MTPKEKRQDLIRKLYEEGLSDRQVVECVNILINEAVSIVPFWDYKQKSMFDECKNEPDDRFVTFRQEVKQQ